MISNKPSSLTVSGRRLYKCAITPYALEAKLVGANGFCISLISCWLENSENMDEKQDCELKAFCRLAAVLKKAYPRLPVLLLADGLYANQTVFGICRKNNWRFIITFKEGKLKTLWQEIELLLPLHSGLSV